MMSFAWLERCRAWGDRHPRLTRCTEIVALFSSTVVGLCATGVLATDALLLGLHAAGRTASREGVALPLLGKSVWVVAGAALAIGVLLYARFLQRVTSRLPDDALLALCVMTIGFALLIDTVCGHMGAMITLEGDNDWVSGALKLWTWATWALCAPPMAEWMQRNAGRDGSAKAR